MGCLNREAVFTNRPPAVSKVLVPEWGDGAYVYARPIRASEFAKLTEGADDITMMVRWVIAGACDRVGNPLFNDADTERLLAQPFRVVQRVAEAVMDANGLGEGAESARKKSPKGTK
jgi:hypothetical protein